MKFGKSPDDLHEQLKFFRDDETGADANGIVNPNEETIKINKLKEKEKITREIGSPDELCQIIMDAVAELDDLEVVEKSKNDREQQALLDKKVGQAKKMIEDTGKLTRKYVQSIEDWHAVKAKSEENESSGQKFLQDLIAAENARTNSHNALISQLNATIRFLNFNFSQNIAEEALADWEDDQLKRGQKILQIKRVGFKQTNVILPDSVVISNRKHITAWAEQISQSLSKIEKLLSEKPKSSLND